MTRFEQPLAWLNTRQTATRLIRSKRTLLFPPFVSCKEDESRESIPETRSGAAGAARHAFVTDGAAGYSLVKYTCAEKL